MSNQQELRNSAGKIWDKLQTNNPAALEARRVQLIRQMESLDELDNHIAGHTDVNLFGSLKDPDKFVSRETHLQELGERKIFFSRQLDVVEGLILYRLLYPNLAVPAFKDLQQRFKNTFASFETELISSEMKSRAQKIIDACEAHPQMTTIGGIGGLHDLTGLDEVSVAALIRAIRRTGHRFEWERGNPKDLGKSLGEFLSSIQ